MSEPEDDIYTMSEQDRAAAQQYKSDVEWLMSSSSGRRIMYRLCERGGIFHAQFCGNEETQYRRGMQNLALMFQADVFEFNLEEKFFLMMKEAKVKT